MAAWETFQGLLHNFLEASTTGNGDGRCLGQLDSRLTEGLTLSRSGRYIFPICHGLLSGTHSACAVSMAERLRQEDGGAWIFRP